MALSAQEVVLEYPLAERVRCPRCWRSEDSSVTSRGEFSDPPHLAKHLKAKHPGDTISYVCKICKFKGTGRYPQKTVKAHYEKKHGVPLRGAEPNSDIACDINNNNSNDADEAGPSASVAEGASSPNGGFAEIQVAGVWTRSPGAAPRASAPDGGLERGRAADSRQPGLPSTSTTPTRTTTTSATPTQSPSYAAVTAAEPVAKPPSPLAARGPKVTAVESVVRRFRLKLRRPEDAAASTAPQTAAAGARGAPRQVSAGAGAVKKAAPVTRPSKPPVRVPPRPTAARTTTTSGGGTQKRLTDRTPPTTAGSSAGVTTRSRRSASVPVEIGAARLARLPPRPSPTSSTEGSPRGGTARRSPGITPPQASAAGPAARTRSRATSVPVENSALEARRAALARPPARAASRGCPGRSQPRKKSPGTPPAVTNPAGGATQADTTPRGILGGTEPRGVSTTPPPREPAVTPPNRAPALPSPILGRPAGSPLATSPAIPAASVAATLTTSTVTVTTCGAPVMSTGCAPRRPTPCRLSPLPTIVEASPCAVALRRPILGTPPPMVSPPMPTSVGGGQRKDERRQREEGTALLSSSEEEGDMGGPWRLCPGRRAKRRRLSNSPPEAVAPVRAAAPSPGGPPPVTSANYPHLPPVSGNFYVEYPGIARSTTPPSAPAGARRGGASSRGSAEGHAGSSTGFGDVRHPSVRENVRGVPIHRREATASIASTRAAIDEAPPNLASRTEGGGRHHRGRRPTNAPRGQPSRGQPGPAAVVRERRVARVAARDALVARAEGVTSIADLEEFAALVAGFFGEDATRAVGGGASGAPVRPGRSGGATGGVEGRANVPTRGGAQGGNRRGPAPAGTQQSGEGRGGWVREATRIQALYRRNRRKAVREVLQGPVESCQVPIRQAQEYFERLYCGEGSLGNADAFVEQPDPSSQGDAEHLLDPFAEREVDRRLRRMANSAPGPDGVTYRDLREADPGARLLTAVFNACRRLEAVPAAWKTSNTILVYKKGDRGSLENWRPLALGDTIPKLFAAVVADRLTDWAIECGKLSPAQKGFLRDEGCLEHNFVLQEILTDARRTRRQAVVAWLDLSNAFGSVPHATIRRALVRAGVPRGLINIWGSMYDGCTTRVRTADGYTAPVHIRSGVRQGCPLSPIIFDLAIDSVLRAAAGLGAGYEMMGAKISTLAYADDIALIASTPEGMQRLLAVVEEEARRIGLRFNPAKCATLHIGAGNGGRVLPTDFVIQGQPVHHLAGGESYSHLGVPTGFSVIQTPYATIGGLLEDLRVVDRSLLAPWQKIETMATFILPRIDFLLRGARVEKGPLKAVDLNIRRTTKSWLNLPQRASAEVVYLPPKQGGCGLLPLSDLADVLSVAHAFRMLTAGDEAVRTLAWESLRGVVQRRIGHAPSCEDIASFLSGSLEGRMRGGGESSLWSRARNAARRQSDRLLLRWRWVEETRELLLECRGPRGATVKIPPGARSQVVNRLRSAVAEYYAGTLLRKPDQGKVFEVSSRSGVSNHFVRGGSFTRFADWRFVHRARLDVLPLNGTRRWGAGDVRCRRCGGTAETLPHVIGHCGHHAAAIQLRHDAVLHRLWRACRAPGDVRVNQRVEGIDGELGGLRPDLVVRHEPSKSVVICDVTIPFENRLEAFEEARARKIAKYSPIAEALQREGYRVVVTAFVVGALGSWDPRNEAVLSLLRVGSAYAAMMRRLVVSDTIRWSRDIYVEHVSGVRQYLAPSGPRGDGPLRTPPRAVRRRWPAD